MTNATAKFIEGRNEQELRLIKKLKKIAEIFMSAKINNKDERNLLVRLTKGELLSSDNIRTAVNYRGKNYIYYSWM